MKMPELSVIICTHNPRKICLERSLAALREQTLENSKWELLLIDNASTERLSETWNLKWHTNSRHLREEHLGLTPARMHGIREAKGKLLVFVDDDNVLAKDYLACALSIYETMPFLGAWSGQLLAEFEVTPPHWAKPYLYYLAVRELTRDTWANTVQCTGADPYGAGMCVKKEVAATYVERVHSCSDRMTLDRRGASLVSGGDSDLAFTACDMGLAMGTFKRLRLTHLIPKNRLTKTYILLLIREIEFSSFTLRKIRGEDFTCLPGVFSWWLRAGLGLLKRNGFERRAYLARLQGQLKFSKLHSHVRS